MRARLRCTVPAIAVSSVSVVAHRVPLPCVATQLRRHPQQTDDDSFAVAISVAEVGIPRRRGTIPVAGGSPSRPINGVTTAVGLQALIYFSVAGGSLALALSLLYARYMRQDPQAVRSRGGFTLFAVCLLLFAVGAAAAGLVSAQAGR